MTVVSRNIGVHFVDEQTLANLSRIMFASQKSNAVQNAAAAAAAQNSTKDTPVSYCTISKLYHVNFSRSIFLCIQEGVCGLLHSNYLWEFMILWELLLPLFALIIVLAYVFKVLFLIG